MFDQRTIAGHEHAAGFALDQRPNVVVISIGGSSSMLWLANGRVDYEHGKQRIDFPFAQAVKRPYLFAEKTFPVLRKEGRRQ